MLPRGGGSSQAGQTVNASLVIDCSKHLTRILDLDVAGRALHGRARHRARRSQPRAEAARAVVSGRRLDRLARHHRRHDGQQLLRRRARCATATRARTSSRSTRCWPTAARRISGRWRPTCPTCRRIRRCGRWRATCSRSARARRTRSRRASPRCSAGSAATTSTRWCRARNDVNLAHILVGSRRHAGVLDRDRTEAVAAARPPRGRRLPFRQLPRGDGGGAAHRQARADRGRAGRPHHDRAGARHRDVPADAGSVRARRRPRRSCWSSSPRTIRTRTCAACARLHELIGDLGFAWDKQRRQVGRRGRRARSRSCRPRSPSFAPPASTS